ncbi:MAG TPA: tetratricopeptide repeat protein, partial [Plasticicumulans sp.]|nr:tetratricopeptide repeat protein [Plasticicumulans sp.]
MLHHQVGELAEAEALYRAALARQPDDAPVLNLLGQIRLERGDAQEAAALLGRAWQLAPQTPGLALVLGQALHAH